LAPGNSWSDSSSTLRLVAFRLLLVIPDFQLRLESPAERPLEFSNGPTLDAVEVLMDLHARLDVNILEGSCVESVDEPLAVRDDLGANEIPSVLTE
jgi:hypothetical protein